MEKKRYDNLDLMKMIAIILVIILHTPLFDFDFIASPTISKKLSYGVRLILEGVPIFVTINGFLTLKKENLDIKKHIKKILNTLFVLIAWSVILIISGMLITKNIQNFRFNELVHNILTTNISSNYNGVLWFLQSLLGLYFIYPVLNYIYVNKYDLFKYLFVFVSIFTVGINFISIINNIVQINYLDELVMFANQTNPFRLEWFIFYFMLGGIIYKNIQYIKEKRLMFILFGIVSFGCAFFYGYYMSVKNYEVFQPWFNSNSVFMTFIILGFLALTLSYKNNGKIIHKFISNVGGNTLGIYLSHFIFLFIAWNYFNVSTFAQKILVSLFVFWGSYVLTIILGKIPYLKKLLIK